MRAIDYGLQYYGGFSYKNSKTNICVFNGSKIIDDDTNEINSQDDSIIEIVYKEVEYEDDGNKSILFIPNGEIISFETFEYLRQSGTTIIEEFKIKVETNQYNDDVLHLTERIIYKIDNKFYAKIDGANFTLNDVELIAQSKKAKQDIPLFLLNNELYNKKVSVVVFISDDGAALERAYQSIECFNNEVVIFVENNKGANLFGSVLRVKLGSNISDLTGFPSHQVAKIINAFRLEVAIDTKIISQVIQEEINNNSGLLHFIKKRWLIADKVVTVSAEYVFDLLAETIEELFSKKLDNAKFNENRWQYYTSDGSINKDANLLFFNPAIFDDLDDKAKSKLTKSIFKSAQEELSQHEQYFNILWNQAKNNEKLKFYYKVIYKGVKKINSLFSILNDFLKTQSSITINFTKEIGIALNAFLVGLLNGIIEVIKGFFDIVALLCKGVSAVQFEAKNITSYVGIFIESIENFIDGIINLFTKENLNAILNFTIDIFSFITVLPQKIINFFTDTDFTTTIDRVAYYIGYIIGMIIDVIVGAITTGGAKTVADVVKIIAKQFTDLLKLGKEALEKGAKLAANFLDNIIAIFAKLRNGAKNIKPFLDEILEFLRKLFGAIPKSWNEIFAKFGISVQKVPQSVLYSGIPVKVGDDVFALLKDGKEIFRGTKKEIDELAEKLKKMSDEEVKKYIDDLLENIKLDDYINKQDFKFRKLGLKYHHTFKVFKSGMKEINHFIIDKTGKKILQGTTSIDNNGVLFNIFDVSFDYQGQDISKAMYELIKKYEFKKIECSYPANSMKDNYEAFMKTYNKELDNKVEAALNTPSGKSIKTIFENKFKPTNITIKEGRSVHLYWEKK